MGIFRKTGALAIVFSMLWMGVLNAQAENRQPYEPRSYDASRYMGLDVGRGGQKIDLRPKEIYGSAPLIGIRIGNGGAGYTGLLRALSEAYLATKPTINGKPFSIAWYPTNSTYSYFALRDHAIDLALAYEIWPEALSGSHAFGQDLTLLFKDAFIFVGPVANPADLIVRTADKKGDTMDDMLEKIIATGCKTPFAQGCSMYLSRSDLSGTYKKETTLMIAHRTPQDLILKSPWYFPSPLTPKAALKEAGEKGLYTMNDKSTWISQPALQNNLKIYLDGATGEDPNLNNPCYGLLARDEYLQSDQPRRFLKWLAGPEGQRIIASYGVKEFGAPIVRARETRSPI